MQVGPLGKNPIRPKPKYKNTINKIVKNRFFA